VKGSNRHVSRREFEEVMRRASELAAHDPEGDERAMSEDEVLRIGREVGLPEAHVRRALVDVRTVAPAARGVAGFLGWTQVRAAREVPGSQKEVAAQLDEFLVAGQLLQAVRRGKGILVYRPAVDWVSQVARAASSTSRSFFVASAKHVEVHLSEAGSQGENTLVEIEVDPGIRGDHMAGAILGGLAAGAGGGIGVAFALGAIGGPLGVAIVAGVMAGTGAAGSVAWLTSRNYQNKIMEVQMEVEGILDRLETGESLEPPPPSWRRWVKRQFHGVARDLRGDIAEGEDEADRDWDMSGR